MLLDQVFNHTSNDENPLWRAILERPDDNSADGGLYFNGSTPWGNRVATEKRDVQDLLIDTCKMYLAEYHVDSFRFDATTYVDHGFLLRLADELTRFRPKVVLVAENKALLRERVFQDANFFSSDGLGDIYYFSHSRYAAHTDNTVNYVESHDETSVAYEAGTNPVTNQPATKDRKGRLGLFGTMTALGQPMIYMGQEFNVERPGGTVSFPWPQPTPGSNGFYRWASPLIRLRRRYLALRIAGYDPAGDGRFSWILGPWMGEAHGRDRIVLGWGLRPNGFAYDTMVVLLNFEPSAVRVDLELGVAGTWVKLADLDTVNDIPPAGTNATTDPSALRSNDGRFAGFELPSSSAPLQMGGLTFRWRGIMEPRLVTTDEPPLGWRYAAFISYSHRADAAVARALRSGLHGFCKPWYRLRAVRVFLDDATLSVNSALWEPIAAALDASRFLILVASPEAARSPWVAREIERFLANHPEDQLLMAVTDGAFRWDGQAGDVDWSTTTVLPEILRGRLRAEPRWLDLTWARSAPRLTLDDAHFLEAVADVAATVHRRPKDEMFGDDVRQHRRTTRLARLIVAVVLSLAMGLAVLVAVAISARNTAEFERNVALSRQLAAESQLALNGRLDVALLLGVQSRRIDDDIEGRSALLSALQRTPELTTYLDHRDGPIRALAVSGDGSVVMWCSGGGEVALWDVARRTKLGSPMHSSMDVQALAFSPDGRRIAMGGADGRVEMWDTATRALVAVLPDRLDEVRSVAFSPDGKFLAAGGWAAPGGSAIIVWDAARLRRLDRQPAAADHNVQQLVFSPDGSALAAAAGEVVRWDTRSWVMTGHFVADGEASAVAYSHDGVTLAASGNGSRSSILLVDANTWTPRAGPLLGHQGRVDTLAFSRDDRLLVSGGLDNRVIEWDLSARRQQVALVGHTDDVLALRFLDGGSVVSASADGDLLLWNPARNAWGADVLSQREGGGSTLTFLAGSSMLLTATPDGRGLLWDLANRTVVRRFTDDTSPFGHFLVASQRGSVIVTADMHGNVAVHDPADGRTLRRFVVSGATAVAGLLVLPEQPIAIDSDGKTVVAAIGPQLDVLDVGTGAVLLHDADGGEAVAISADGRRVAAFRTGSALRVWQRGDGGFAAGPNQIAIGTASPRRDPVLAFSPDGDTIAVTDGTAVRLAYLNGASTRVDVLGGQTERMTALAFSPDGTLLATGGQDGLVLLRDLSSGRTIGSFRPGDRAITSLAFSADGKRLASALEPPVSQVDQNGRLVPAAVGPLVMLWNVDLAAWNDQACAIAGRNLSRAEWARYVGANVEYSSTCPQFEAGT